MALQGVSRKTTKADILICVAAALLSLVVVFFVFVPKGEGKTVIVEVDGEIYDTFNLNEAKKEIEIRSKYGYNIISVGDGYAVVVDADCPDKLDVKRGKISRAGEEIVCLPNRLRLYISGEGEIDAVSY